MTQRRIYQNCHPYLITSTVLKRAPLFDKEEYAKALSNTILKTCNSLSCSLYAFCIMPDHVHMLLSTNNRCNISKVMQQIKSITAKELRESYDFNVKFWQARFNHRIVDTKTGISEVISYIKNNHIKWGLDKKYSILPYLYVK